MPRRENYFLIGVRKDMQNDSSSRLFYVCVIAAVMIVALVSISSATNAEPKRGDYCMELQKNIMNDQQDPDLFNLTIQEINTYAIHCSS